MPRCGVSDFRLPSPDSRTLVIGGTGSGKSTFLAWLLSRMDFDRRQWFAIDSKRDPRDVFVRLVKAKIARSIAPPDWIARRGAGLSIVHPKWKDDDSLERFFEAAYRAGNVGILIDELFSVPNGSALERLYYQGRSKRVQILAACQRPVDITRYAISQSDCFAISTLRDADDYRRVKGFVPSPDLQAIRPQYHFLWYDAPRHAQFVLTPAPPVWQTIDNISARQPYRYW